MWTFRARLSVIAVAILIVSFANPPAYARGGYVGDDDPWNSKRIDRLPLEVRNVVIHICADPRAGHYFATYFDNSQLIKLHFEHLHCDGRFTFCRGGSCLRQEYISTGSRYRLIKSYYGPR